MSKKYKIIGICGSLRKLSYNKGLLDYAIKNCPEEIEIEPVDISNIPLFNQDLEGSLPDIVKELKEKIKLADGVLFASPEYNYSVSGVLKNVIDWCSRPYGQGVWGNKPIAIMGASTGGFGTVRGQRDLRNIFLGFNSPLLSQPETYISFAIKKFDENGVLQDKDSQEAVKKLLNSFKLWLDKIVP